jgi:hypothetical protein
MSKIIRLFALEEEWLHILNRIVDELRVRYASYLTTKVTQADNSTYVWAEMGIAEDGDTITFSVSMPSSNVETSTVFLDREKLFIPIHMQSQRPISFVFEDGAIVDEVFWFCLKKLCVFGDIYYMEDTDKNSISKNLTRQQKRKLHSVDINLTEASKAIEHMDAKSDTFLQKTVESLLAQMLVSTGTINSVVDIKSLIEVEGSPKLHWLTGQSYFTNCFRSKVNDLCAKARDYDHLDFTTATAHVKAMFDNIYFSDYDLVRFWFCYLDYLEKREIALPINVHPMGYKRFVFSLPSVAYEKVAHEDQSFSHIERAQVYFHLGDLIYLAYFEIEVNLRRNTNEVKFKLTPIVKENPKRPITDW